MDAKTILIADDDIQLLQALSLRFKAMGCEVHWARDGYQALQFANTLRPDVLILDINMPAGDGFSVVERLASLGNGAVVPIVFVTGEDSARIDSLAERFGQSAVVSKPFEFENLLSAIEFVTSASTSGKLG